MRIDRQSSRQRENTDTDFTITQSYIPPNTVSQCNLKSSPHHCATKRENNSYPKPHPYMVGAAGCQTNTGFMWFLPAQTDKRAGIYERSCHTLQHTNTTTSLDSLAPPSVGYHLKKLLHDPVQIFFGNCSIMGKVGK